MTTPHPSETSFAREYSAAWTSEPTQLLEFFALEGIYTDVAMGATYRGHAEVGRFHRWMLKFASDSVVEFSNACATDGRLYLEWIWSGTFEGSLRLPDGTSMRSTGKTFSVPGVASCRYRTDGKLLGHRDYWDLASMLRQVDAA